MDPGSRLSEESEVEPVLVGERLSGMTRSPGQSIGANTDRAQARLVLLPVAPSIVTQTVEPSRCSAPSSWLHFCLKRSGAECPANPIESVGHTHPIEERAAVGGTGVRVCCRVGLAGDIARHVREDW